MTSSRMDLELKPAIIENDSFDQLIKEMQTTGNWTAITKVKFSENTWKTKVFDILVQFIIQFDDINEQEETSTVKIILTIETLSQLGPYMPEPIRAIMIGQFIESLQNEYLSNSEVRNKLNMSFTKLDDCIPPLLLSKVVYALLYSSESK
ncbi:MAG: hypothetical protein ACYCQI_12345 [Gammaproteobacteria bacterium]